MQDLQVIADKNLHEKTMLKKSLVQLGSPKVETPYTSLNSMPKGVAIRDSKKNYSFIPTIPRINRNKGSLGSASDALRGRDHSLVPTSAREDGEVKINES